MSRRLAAAIQGRRCIRTPKTETATNVIITARGTIRDHKSIVGKSATSDASSTAHPTEERYRYRDDCRSGLTKNTWKTGRIPVTTHAAPATAALVEDVRPAWTRKATTNPINNRAA